MTIQKLFVSVVPIYEEINGFEQNPLTRLTAKWPMSRRQSPSATIDTEGGATTW